MASADHEVGVWLRQQGADPYTIEAEIRSLHGYTVEATPASIDYEEEEPTHTAPYARWTDRARKVMQLANQEAQRFNHEYIGTEHILLGLIKEGSGVAAEVFRNLGVQIRKIREEVKKQVQSRPDALTMGKLPQTPRASRVIEYSMEEARHLNHNYIGTEHVLLGLLREPDSVAARVLISLGLRLEDVRKEVLGLLGYGTVSPQNRERSATEGGADQTGRHATPGPLADFLAAVKRSPSMRGTFGFSPSVEVLRVLDAAANRGREGLRVIEDYVRFVLDDQHLTELCKQLRHDLTAATSQISADRRIAARETQDDVGTMLTAPAERRRDDLTGVVRANFARLQESLRSLEEFGKLWPADAHEGRSSERQTNTSEQQIAGGQRPAETAPQTADPAPGQRPSPSPSPGQRLGEASGLEIAGGQRPAETASQTADPAPGQRPSPSPSPGQRPGEGDATEPSSAAQRANPSPLPSSPRLSDQFKQLRYRTYTLERAVEITRGSLDRLAAVRLYVLLDGRDSPDEFQRLVVSLIQAGVHAIQLRDKQLGDRELLARAGCCGR